MRRLAFGGMCGGLYPSPTHPFPRLSCAYSYRRPGDRVRRGASACGLRACVRLGGMRGGSGIETMPGRGHGEGMGSGSINVVLYWQRGAAVAGLIREIASCTVFVVGFPRSHFIPFFFHYPTHANRFLPALYQCHYYTNVYTE